MLSGCSDAPPEPEPFRATYEGELHWDKDPGRVGRKGIDTVEVGISGVNYSFFMLTNKANISGVRGRVSGFGTTSAQFSPTEYFCGTCDTVRTLRGTYQTVFRGDSLYMDGSQQKGSSSWVYSFRLLRVGP